MRLSTLRGLTVFSLCTWLLSGCLAQVLWFHVQADHVGDHHHAAPGLLAMLHHPDTESEHEHQITDSSSPPAIVGSSVRSSAPPAALLPLPWSTPAPGGYDPTAPDPRPRGRPLALERLTTLLI